jgi:hypothetical protein
MSKVSVSLFMYGDVLGLMVKKTIKNSYNEVFDHVHN